MPISKTKIIIFLLTALIIILLLVRLRQNNPPLPPSQPAPTPISSQVGQPQPLKITFTGTPITPPPTLNLYQSSTTTPHQYTQEVAAKLNLTQLSQSTHIWMSADKKIGLVLDQINDYPQLSWQNPPNPNPGIDIAKAFVVAQQTLTPLGLTSFMPDKNNLKFINSQSQEFTEFSNLKTVSPDQAFFLIIPLRPSINNIPIAYATSKSYTAQIVIDNNLQPSYLSFFNPLPNPSIIDNRPSITIPEALLKIEAGNYTYTNINNAQKLTTPPSTLTLNIVTLEYRLDPNTSTIVPYYCFSGNDGMGSVIELITLAIK